MLSTKSAEKTKFYVINSSGEVVSVHHSKTVPNVGELVECGSEKQSKVLEVFNVKDLVEVYV